MKKGNIDQERMKLDKTYLVGTPFFFLFLFLCPGIPRQYVTDKTEQETTSDTATAWLDLFSAKFFLLVTERDESNKRAQ